MFKHFEILLQFGNQEHHRTAGVQSFGHTFIHAAFFRIPSGSFKEHSIHIGTFLWFLSHLMSDHLEIEHKEIDGDTMFSCDILHDTGGEGVGEEEPRNPIGVRMSFLDPFIEEDDSVLQVGDEGSYWLRTFVGLASPHVRHFAVEQAEGSSFQLTGHHDQTFQSFVHFFQGRSNQQNQHVESLHFLCQHCVHGVLVFHRVLFLNFGDVKMGRETVEHTVHNLSQQFV